MIAKTFTAKDGVEAAPLDGVKGLLEVQLKNNSRGAVGAEQVCRINEIFRNATPMDKTYLIDIDNARNGSVEAVGHCFREEIHGAVWKGYRAKSICCAHPLLLGKKNQMSSVQPVEIERAVIEAIKELLDIVLNRGPKLLIEGGDKAIQSRTGIHVHREQRPRNFIHGKRGRQFQI
jgi:hypothetical protein